MYCVYMYCFYMYYVYVLCLYTLCVYVLFLYVLCVYVLCLYVLFLYVLCLYVLCLNILKFQGRGDEDSDSEESDWEPEAEIMPPEREQTRSGRQRKRPSFFQVSHSSLLLLDFLLLYLKGTNLILSEPPFVNWHFQFTALLFKPSTDQD